MLARLTVHLTLLAQPPVPVKATHFPGRDSRMRQTEVWGGDVETLIARTQQGRNCGVQWGSNTPFNRFAQRVLKINLT